MRIFYWQICQSGDFIIGLPKIYRPILKCENIYHLTAVRIEMYSVNIWTVDKALPSVNIPLTPVITPARGGQGTELKYSHKI